MAPVLRALRAVAQPAVFRTPASLLGASHQARSRPFSTTRPTLLRKYTKEHEWIDISADRKSGVIGITEYAAEQLGDVVYVELPSPGSDFVAQGDAVGAVESVKSASDINAPVRCKVTQVNTSLEEKPSTINKVPEDDSHGGGWIVKVALDEDGAKQADELMDLDAYRALVSG